MDILGASPGVPDAPTEVRNQARMVESSDRTGLTTAGPRRSVSVHVMTHAMQLPRNTSLPGVLVLVLGILRLVLIQGAGSGAL